MASFVRREERRRRLFGVLRRERTFRANERYDLENMSDEECYAKFRFTKTSISSLLAELNLTVLTARSRAVSPLLQLLVCLRFLGTGTFYSVVGDVVFFIKVNCWQDSSGGSAMAGTVVTQIHQVAK